MKYFALWQLSRPYPPTLMVPAIEATVFGLPKLFPSSIKSCYSYWEKGKNSYFYNNEEMTKTIDDIIDQAMKDDSVLYGFFKTAHEKAKELNKYSSRYSQIDISDISTDELLDFYKKFNEIFYDMYAYATLLPILGYKEENPIYIQMNKILKEKIKDSPEKFADYLINLTNPRQKLHTNDLDLEILKIAKKIKEKGLKTKEEIKREFREELCEVKKNFEWLSYDFTDKIGWDLDHFVDRVLEKMEIEIDDKIKYLNNYEEEVKKDFEKACGELDLSEEEINVFRLVSDLGYYKWAREYEFQEALYNLGFVQNEIGRRHGLSTLESMYVFVDEYKENLENLKELAQKRIDCCLVVANIDKGTTYLYGEDAKKEYDKFDFMEEEIIENMKEVEGTPARAGKEKGKVKIINSVDEMTKMEKGDVLVSIATTPSILMAMKKAVAIVTDEGGITCHAAIVSRELGIPCVVGTKIATKVLKDGDLVEVDADKGIIKIIKHNKQKQK